MGLKSYPRIIIAGLGGDSGKTFVSCGLLRYFRNTGLNIGVFKKGPDYIDPAWLKIASGSDARSLDTYLMPKGDLQKSFLYHAYGKDINIIEGNRGLFDGFDSKGSHSTAVLAKMLSVPVILVVMVKKVTRTTAALVLGCKNLDSDLNIAGVIINQVAGKRHEKIIREVIELETGIPVVGAIPKLKSGEIMPARHLGLITPGEYDIAEKAINTAKDAISEYVDVKKIIKIANSAKKIEFHYKEKMKPITCKFIRIGYFSDKIFSFYYPENLEALEEEGAELMKISSYDDNELPDIDALYIGGGFPESNIEHLLANKSMMKSVKRAAERGMPIYAECGGLIYLGKSIESNGKEYELSGVLPVKFRMNKKPQGHGYTEILVDNDNPYYEKGLVLKGHEFHYSEIIEKDDSLTTCFNVKRGTGSFDKRDGLLYKKVFGSYMHIHAIGCPEWQKGIIRAAKEYKEISK